jgi:hypothetical protein
MAASKSLSKAVSMVCTLLDEKDVQSLLRICKPIEGTFLSVVAILASRAKLSMVSFFDLAVLLDLANAILDDYQLVYDQLRVFVQRRCIGLKPSLMPTAQRHLLKVLKWNVAISPEDIAQVSKSEPLAV